MMRCLLLLLLATTALAETPAERVSRLQNSLLAPCCYTGTVAMHSSEVALEMRREIRDWVAQGRSDRQILDTYKARYGARVLVEPEGRPWWMVHIVTWSAVALGLGIVLLVIRRLRPRRAVAPLATNLPPLPETDEDWARLER
jgi:cytochrome c-type biogenesis protein CcmH